MGRRWRSTDRRAESIDLKEKLRNMSENDRVIAELGSTAVYNEFVEEVRRAGGGSIDPPMSNALWPIEQWTESQRSGFEKCLAATANLFPKEVRSTLLVTDVQDDDGMASSS